MTDSFYPYLGSEEGNGQAAGCIGRCLVQERTSPYSTGRRSRNYQGNYILSDQENIFLVFFCHRAFHHHPLGHVDTQNFPNF